MARKRNKTITQPYVWDKKALPVLDSDDKRGKFRHDMDKILGRAMTRYLGNTLEWVFPHISLKITGGTWLIKVTTSINSMVGATTTHTCPETVVNGNVTINGNLLVNGTVTVTGDVVAGGVSLINHTHPGDSGGTTGAPS